MTVYKKEDFDPHVSTTFEVQVPDVGQVPIELFEVKASSSGSMDSFSLLFKGGPDRVFRHDTFTVKHPVMGAFELFLGPIHTGQTDVVHYQAIFTTLK